MGRLITVLLAVTYLVDVQRLAFPEDGMEYLLRHWVALHSEPVPNRLVRWRYMLTQSRASQKDFDLVRETFKIVTGLDVQVYFDAGLEVYAGLYDKAHRVLNGDDEWLVVEDYFHKEPAAEAVLSVCQATVADLCKQVAPYADKPQELLVRSRHWQLTPVVRQGSEYFCMSLPFLAERLSSGAHYLVLDNLRPNEKRRYMTWLGHAFEQYMLHLLSSVWMCHPEQQEAMADVTITAPQGEVLVECKTKRIPITVFENGDVDDFRKHLRADTGVRKGAQQLSQRFIQIIKGTYPVGLDVCSTIPLVCTLEATPAIWHLGEEVDRVVTEFAWPVGTTPAVVSAFDLETLVAYHETTTEGIETLREWVPQRNDSTLADFLRSKRSFDWMGTFQTAQWKEATMHASQLLNAAIYKKH